MDSTDSTDPQPNSSKIIFSEIFKIFLKTGRKRVILSILCGTIIFLTITSLIMVVYTRRFETFQTFQAKNVDWLNDGDISIGSNRENFCLLDFPDNYLDNLSNEFISKAQEYIPGLDVYNYTAAISIATPNAPTPLTPNRSKINVVISKTDTVTPEIGLFDEPNNAAIYPAIADATNANNTAKTAMNADTAHKSEI